MMGDTRSDGPQFGTNSLSSILSTLQNGVRALYDISTKISTIFPQVSGTSTTATGGSITPPAQVVGYISVTLPNGTSAKIPYYN
jgi:hypothetical protein